MAVFLILSVSYWLKSFKVFTHPYRLGSVSILSFFWYTVYNARSSRRHSHPFLVRCCYTRMLGTHRYGLCSNRFPSLYFTPSSCTAWQHPVHFLKTVLRLSWTWSQTEKGPTGPNASSAPYQARRTLQHRHQVHFAAAQVTQGNHFLEARSTRLFYYWL